MQVHAASDRELGARWCHSEAWPTFQTRSFKLAVDFTPAVAPEGDIEMQARNALQDGEISWLTLQDLFDRLPSDHLDRGDEFNQDASALPPKSYTVGGFAHSSFMGLRRHTLRSPWFTTLLTSIIRYISPGHCFTTVTASRNVMTLMHMDNHNDEWSSNLVVPFSEYLAGQVWIACPDGDVQLVAHGQLGRLHSTQTPLCFNPRLHHATAPWEGQRYVLVAFHIRSASRLKPLHMQDLLRLGFKPLTSCVINATAELRMRQTLGEQGMRDYLEAIEYSDQHNRDDHDDDGLEEEEKASMTMSTA
eukprot:s2047_g12.t1